MTNIIEATDIRKAYYGHVALDGLNITVGENMVYGLLGPNGAGKTTFIRILTQITKQDSGELLFNGHPLKPSDVDIVGYLPEERGLYKKMKVGEQALYLSQLKGLSRHDALVRLKYWFDKFEIGEWWNKKVDELSKGMQQKVQFICTVLHEPKLLIFDEPFSGFDPVNANLLKNEILGLRDRGATVLFSTHNMQSVEEICDAITLVNQSKDVLSGAVNEVRQRYKENKFNLQYIGTEDMLSGIANVEVLSSNQVGEVTNAQVKCTTGMKAPELIRYMASQLPLTGIKEELPSMNEIFINAVKKQ